MSNPNDSLCLEAYLHAALSPLQKGCEPQPFGAALCGVIPSDREVSGASLKAGKKVLLRCRGYAKDANLPRAFLVHLALTCGLLKEGEQLSVKTTGLTDILIHYDMGRGLKSDGSEFIGGEYLETVNVARQRGRLIIDNVPNITGKGAPLAAKWWAKHVRDNLVHFPQSPRETTLGGAWEPIPKERHESFVIDYEVGKA